MPADGGSDDPITECFTVSDWWTLCFILALCVVIAALRWVKMESLYNVDPSMWLFQVQRFARGEAPYRDFSWNYPPLSILVLGWLARAFGPTFAVIQTAVDVLSLIVVLLGYWLVRYCLPRVLHLITIVAVVAVCSTTATKFGLFCFETYSPSLLFAAVGLLLLLLGGLRQIQRPGLRRPDFILMAAGTFIAAASKPEALVAAVGGVLVLAALGRTATFAGQPGGRWMRYYVAVLAGGLVPAMVLYLAVVMWVGLAPLKWGLSGYGLASYSCPWWPTGLGVFGGAAATGEAVFIAAALLWGFRRKLLPNHQRLARRLWACALPGLLIFLGYVWFLCRDVWKPGVPLGQRVEQVARSVIWTSPVLLPVMWSSIWVCLICLIRFRTLSLAGRRVSFFLSIPVMMSVRSLFGTTLFPYTEVSAMCYPFFVVAAPCLLWLLLCLVERSHWKTVLIAGALGGYSLLRLAGAYPSMFSNARYYSLSTEAGIVRLSDGGVSAQIYRYIVENTKPSDVVLDLPYGGGFNFASGRPGATFTSQFRQLRMPVEYQQRDLDQVINRKPRVVIATDDIHYASFWGHNANMNCTFPRLQWIPTEPSWDPDYVFPVIRYIEQYYKPVRRVGGKLILIPAR
jgi:energy-converting hydrogenase Eha subunit E